jgi:outer membrane protein assembly factor BamB
VGLDKQTGKELWRADAEGLGMVWGTPAVAEASGVAEIVLGAPYEIWALNPQSGKLRWYCAANNDDQFSSSVIANHGIVYAFGGRGGGSVAVKAGGKDDVSETNLVWKGNDSTRFSTPILYEERLYNVSGGIVTCLSAQTGEEIFKGRLQSATRPSQTDNGQDNQARRGGGNRSGRGGFGGGMGSSDYASPIIADGKLYYIGRGGDMYVLEAGNEFKLLAVNRVTNDNEDFSATPAVSDGRIYIRSNKHLYCIGKE